MPMTSLFQGFEAGLRLAEPVSRGIETRARAGIEGQIHREQNERLGRRDRLHEEMMRDRSSREAERHRMVMNAPKTEFDAIEREVDRAFAAIGKLQREAEEARAAGDEQGFAKAMAKSELFENLIRQKKARFQAGEPVIPPAKVTRRADGTVSATYEVPMDQLDAYLTAADSRNDPLAGYSAADRVEIEMLNEEIGKQRDAYESRDKTDGSWINPTHWIPSRWPRSRLDVIRDLERRRDEIIRRGAPPERRETQAGISGFEPAAGSGAGPATGPTPFDPALPEGGPPESGEAAAPAPEPGSIDAVMQGAAEADRTARAERRQRQHDRRERARRRGGFFTGEVGVDWQIQQVGRRIDEWRGRLEEAVDAGDEAAAETARREIRDLEMERQLLNR